MNNIEPHKFVEQHAKAGDLLPTLATQIFCTAQLDEVTPRVREDLEFYRDVLMVIAGRS